MKLLVVIVNYRTADLTIDCLASTVDELSGMHDARIVAVDNDSQDGSAARICKAIDERGWGPLVTLLPLDCNGGFASGNNAAIRPALQSADPPDYVLLLNPDTLVRPGAIRTLVDFLESRPDVGLVGSRLEDPDGTPQCSAFRFPSVLSELDNGLRIGLVSRLLSKFLVLPPIPDVACPIGWVAGASMLVRREVFEEIGLLDEAYFLYYEEVDFCLRAAKAGWPCWYEPASHVVHLVGRSTGVTAGDNCRTVRRPQYWFESRRRYFLKNHGRLAAAAADALWSLGYSFWALRAKIQKLKSDDPPMYLRDFIRHSVFLRGFGT